MIKIGGQFRFSILPYAATHSAAKKRPDEAGRFCWSRIGVTRLFMRLVGIVGILAGSLVLLSGLLTAALLLTWL
jgi:hypothetical protein